MKTCSNGAYCVHPEGPDLDETEFYQYPYREVHQCIQCKKHYGKTHNKETRQKYMVKSPSRTLRKIAVSLRADTLFDWCSNGQIRREHFVGIIENVKLK